MGYSAIFRYTPADVQEIKLLYQSILLRYIQASDAKGNPFEMGNPPPCAKNVMEDETQYLDEIIRKRNNEELMPYSYI